MACKKWMEIFFFKYFEVLDELNVAHTLNISTMLTPPSAPGNREYCNIDAVQAVAVDTLNQVQPWYFHPRELPREYIAPIEIH